MRIASLWIFITALAMPLHAVAQGVDDPMCRNGLFPSEPVTFSLARVIGSGPLHFRADTKGCPWKGGETCVSAPYVVPGDTVIVSKTKGDFQCAYFPGKKGGTAGWVMRNRIAPISDSPTPALSSWIGTWKDGDNRLLMSVVDRQVRVRGQAWWPAKDVPTSEIPGGPNVGDVTATAAPFGNQMTFEDGQCHVRATLLGSLLLVSDDRNCGGMNVTFTGVYRQASASAHR